MSWFRRLLDKLGWSREALTRQAFNDAHERLTAKEFGADRAGNMIQAEEAAIAAHRRIHPVPSDTFHAAVAAGEVDKIRQWLERGFDANDRGDRGITPLHVAAMNAQPECALVLIRHGADVHAKAMGHITPLRAAVEAKQAEVVRVLLANGVRDKDLDAALADAEARQLSDIVQLLRVAKRV